MNIKTKTQTYSRNTQRAIKNYGENICINAERIHRLDGEGASTIGCGYGLTTQQTDAAINAGREIYLAERDARRRTLVLNTFFYLPRVNSREDA